MNARIYASLFSRKDRIKFIGFSIFFLFIAFLVSISKRQGRAGTDVGFLIVLPVLGFGGILAEVWNRPLQRPTTALLPALQRTLFPWYIRLFLAVALVWAVMIHWVEPGIPLAAAVGISAGMFALPIPSVLYRNRPAESKLRRILFLFLGIIIGGNGVTLFARNQLLTHASLAGAMGLALTVANLWIAQKRRSPATLAQHLIARSKPLGIGRELASILKRALGGNGMPASKPTWNYPPRGDSLLRWVRAAFQEVPWGTLMITGGCVLVVLVHPWAMQHAAGYPLGWYRLVFDPTRFGETGGTGGSTFALTVAMVAFSLGTGRLRTGHLYPISRRQRATVEFAASAASFGISFLGIVGGSVLAGWLVGRWSGLPLFPQPALEFIIRMAMVVPFMPLIRRGALQLEFSQSWVQLFLIIGIVAIFVIASQSLVLAWGLRVGALICLTSIIVSQFAYYAALRQFYTKRDLFQRGPTQDMIGLT